ncbi:TetR/AcrR family transcriptional regulator [Bordetella muralis]|uniref:TetR/AcrR family transcriptional regulator n=1 Tax=Bordetella muralis TaxID=1649130 RepID=UPI0039EE96CD
MANTTTLSDRQRGRPREFDADQVVEQAMQIFWTKGYQGTSLPDLMEATRLSRGSLYAAFNDKHGIFLLALDRYIAQSLQRVDDELTSGVNALEGLKACVDGYIARTDGVAGQRGCLLVATAMEIAAWDQETSTRIAHFFESMRVRISKALSRAQKEGHLGEHVSPDAAAYMVVCFLEGLRVVRKVKGAPHKARAAAQTLISCLAA